MELYTVMGIGQDPYENLALEEHLLHKVSEGQCILYLWQNRHTVVIGRNQNPWVECRNALLQEEGGHLARRLSGGGAVYHDLGNLNFTFICTESSYNLQKQLSVIQMAVQFAGIHAEFSGRNDLLAEGKKFSGNAFYHGQEKAYHHGTLLIDTDIDKLNRYLSPPKAKLESKGITSVRSRVVNLKDLSPSLTCQEMQKHMIQAFQDIYGSHAAPLSLTAEDMQAVLNLKKRYSSQDWLFGKPMPFTCTLENHFSFGHLSLQFFVESGIIQSIQVYTDAMDADLPQKLSSVFYNCPFQTAAMVDAVLHLDIGNELSQFIQHQQL